MDCGGECCCKGPGFCPRYGRNMTPRMWKKCQDPVWRVNFTKFFEADIPVEEEEERIRMMRYERTQNLREENQRIEEIENFVQSSLLDYGVTDDQLEEGPESMSELQVKGLGDMVESLLHKVGVNDSLMGKITGGLSAGGCGCAKRKSFLKKILPFMKSQDEKKEEPEQ